MSQNLTQEPSAKSASPGLFQPEMRTTWSLIINHQALINSSGLWTKGIYCRAAEGPWTLQCAFIWGTWWPSKGGWWSNLLLLGRVKEQQMFVAWSPFSQLSRGCRLELPQGEDAASSPRWAEKQRISRAPWPPSGEVGFNQKKEGSCSRLGKFYRGVFKIEHSREKENIAIKVDSANIFLHSCCCDWRYLFLI